MLQLVYALKVPVLGHQPTAIEVIMGYLHMIVNEKDKITTDTCRRILEYCKADSSIQTRSVYKRKVEEE
jgi:hypothetical protein